MGTKLNLGKVKTVLPMLLLVFGLMVAVCIYDMKVSAEMSRTAQKLYSEMHQNLLEAADTFDVSVEDEIVIGVGATDSIGSAIVDDFRYGTAEDYIYDYGRGKRVGVIDVSGVPDLPDAQYAVEITDDGNDVSAQLIGEDGEAYDFMAEKRDLNDWETSLFGVQKGSIIIYYSPPGCFCLISIIICLA